MRIIYFLTSLGMGGAEHQALELAQRMDAHGHQVGVFVLMPEVAEEWPVELAVTRLNLTKNPAQMPAGLLRARQLLAAFRPDLVHCHCFHSNLLGRLVKLGGLKARVISTVHNVYEGPWQRMLAYRLTDGLAARTAFVCRAAAERYARLGAVSPARSVVMVNGIDSQLFRPDPNCRQRLRTRGEIGEQFLWLSAGRLTAAKDLPNLLTAFARVVRERPEARLWIAGEGERGGLEALATQLGVTEVIRWLGLRRDLRELMDAADGFVLGSAWEGMPLVLGEAMAMETPVVATDVGGVREIVGEAGFLAPARDAGSLAEAMLGVMRLDATDRRVLGARARQKVEAEFALDARASAWEVLYRELLEEAE